MREPTQPPPLAPLNPPTQAAHQPAHSTRPFTQPTPSPVGYPGQSMEYRILGGSGLEVSVLSFGTMTLGGEGRFAAMGNVQVDEARRQIEVCFEAGVNLIDTADAYSGGKSEEVVGQALGARRKDIVLATKVSFEPGPARTRPEPPAATS